MKNIESIPWYRRTLRWGQTNLTEDDPAKDNLAFWQEEWHRKSIEGLIINAGGIVAYYPSRFPLQYRAARLGSRDTFGEWVKAAHDEGITVVARMDINRATEDFYRARPDWFTVDKDGKPYMSQGRYFSCVNSGYYTEYIPAVLTEIIERYHPEGFTDNSWKGLGKHQICYCENCRRKFRERTGLELPEAPDWNDPVYRAWVRFSYDCRTENWDRFNEVTRRVGGKDCLWLGMLNANPMGGDDSFGDLKALMARSSIIFSDHQSRDRINGFEQNAENGNLLRLASFEDCIVPESMANYVRWNRTFRLAADPPEETRMWMWSGIAGGISPWYHHIGSGRDDRRQYETPLPVFRWHAQNEAYLTHTRSLARVAILWSQTDTDFYGREQPKERVLYPYRGFARALHEARLPFLPLHIDDIPRYRDRVDTLIVPDLEAVTDDEVTILLDWLESGKNIVVSGNSAGRDADGELREENPLLRAMGIRLTGNTVGTFDSMSADWEHPATHSYLHLPDWGDTDIVAFGGGLYEAVSDGSLQPFGGYVKPFPIYPPEFAWIREIDDSLHPFFAGTLPSGGRAVWFAADVDRCCGRDRLPDHAKLLGDAVLWASGNSRPFTIEGDGMLDGNFYAQEAEGIRRRVLHITNLSGCDSIGYVSRILPVYGIRVTVPAEGIIRARVRALTSGLEWQVTAENDTLTVTIPRIDAYEALVIENEGGTK